LRVGDGDGDGAGAGAVCGVTGPSLVSGGGPFAVCLRRSVRVGWGCG
jgi:hypothetical protein